MRATQVLTANEVHSFDTFHSLCIGFSNYLKCTLGFKNELKEEKYSTKSRLIDDPIRVTILSSDWPPSVLSNRLCSNFSIRIKPWKHPSILTTTTILTAIEAPCLELLKRVLWIGWEEFWSLRRFDLATTLYPFQRCHGKVSAD